MKKLKYAKQNILEGTLTVFTDEGEIICDMYQDTDGDFMFVLGDEFHYLKDCQFVG